MPKEYVVYYCESMQDSSCEEGASVFTSLIKALEFASLVKNGFCGANTKIKLFELGKEVPIEEVIEKKQVVTETKVSKYAVKEKK